MANPIKGEVELALSDGRSFVLVADHEALIQAATAYGKGLNALFRDLQPPLDADGGIAREADGTPVEGPYAAAASRALLFGLLTARHPAITLRDASEILFTGGQAVGDALAEAIKLGFPDARQDGEAKEPGNAPTPRVNPAGKRSGRSGAKPG